MTCQYQVNHTTQQPPNLGHHHRVQESQRKLKKLKRWAQMMEPKRNFSLRLKSLEMTTRIPTKIKMTTAILALKGQTQMLTLKR